MATNDPVEVRIEKMATWASGVEAQLAELRTSILPTTDECDKISEALGALYDEYSTVRQDARETRNTLGGINDELRNLVEPIKMMEAQARLDAFALNPKTAKPYTAAQIKDLVAVALAKDKEYQKLVFGGIENKDEIALIETQARIDARKVDPATARPYTTEQTKDRATVALAENEQYQKLVTRRRVLEGEKAGTQAIITDCETALSMYRNRNRALCKQLGDLTARLGG